MLSSIVEQSFGRGGKNAAIARFPAFCVTTPSTAPPMTPPMIGTARVIAIDAPRCAPRCANFVAAARVNRHEAFCIAVPLARIAAYCTPSRTPAPTLATSSNSSLALPALPSAAAIAFAATDGSSGSFPAKIASASASRSDVNVVAASCAGIAIGSVNTPPNPATKPLPKFCAVARARSASPLRNSASVVGASSSSTSRGRCALASALALDTRVPSDPAPSRPSSASLNSAVSALVPLDASLDNSRQNAAVASSVAASSARRSRAASSSPSRLDSIARRARNRSARHFNANRRCSVAPIARSSVASSRSADARADASASASSVSRDVDAASRGRASARAEPGASASRVDARGIARAISDARAPSRARVAARRGVRWPSPRLWSYIGTRTVVI